MARRGLRLEFDLERQRGARLCWAAIACSLARHYGLRAPSQAALAREILGRKGDSFADPESVLRRIGVFRRKLSRPLRLAEVRRELRRGRVVVVRIAWDFGGGHLIAITGVGPKGWLTVADPERGSARFKFATVRKCYRGWGRWKQTYLTRGESTTIDS